MMRLAYLPLLLLPAVALAQGAPPQAPGPDQTMAAKERATEGMLIDAIRNWQQAATDKEVAMDTLRNFQQQATAKAKEAGDKDAELKKLSEQVKELEATNMRLVGQAKQRATVGDQK